MTSLRNKIGQMLIMGFSGCEIDNNSPVAKWIQDLALGGVLLFDYDIPAKRYGKNVLSKDQVRNLNKQLQDYSRASSADLPLLIAFDYEGGHVDRLSKVEDCMKTLTPEEMARLDDTAFSLEADKMADTLKDLGFNLNFAPVVDLNLCPDQGIIGKLGRSYSAQPATVVQKAELFVRSFNKKGISCSYKHFPGHGSAGSDTHKSCVDVTETFQDIELEPYRALIQDQNSIYMIMTAHVINRKLDSTGLPATLSHEILTGLLRNKLQYQGVIISDDLQMKAISSHYSLEEALTLTINAGADMLIYGNQLGYIPANEVVDTIEDLVRRSLIKESRIDEAFQRIIRLKGQLARYA